MAFKGIRNCWKNATSALVVASSLSACTAPIHTASPGTYRQDPQPTLFDPGTDGLSQVCTTMNPEAIVYQTTDGGVFGTDYYVVTISNDSAIAPSKTHMLIEGRGPGVHFYANTTQAPADPAPRVHLGNVRTSLTTTPPSGELLRNIVISVSTRARYDAQNRIFTAACFPGFTYRIMGGPLL